MITKIKDLTQEQKDYIIRHYPNSQTWKMSEDLDVSKGVISDYAEKMKIKKDKDFIIIRKENKLTLEQCEFIIENYSNMKNSEIEKILNISYDDLKQFASRRKLNKNEDKKDSIIYTKEQKDFLIENYSKMQNRDLKKILNLKNSQIGYLANKLHLKKDENLEKMNESILTFEQKQFIIDNFSNMKTDEICEKLGLTYLQVKNYASNKKLTKNPYYSKNPSHYFEKSLENNRKDTYNVYDYLGKNSEPKIKEEQLYKSKYGKYHVNQNYFECIDNEWKAYWLGFLYADGANVIRRVNNRNNKMEYCAMLGLAKVDKEHIIKFKNSLQSEAPVKDYSSRLNGKTFYNSKISICNKKVCEDLKEKGCVPNKSLILKFPIEEQVPKYLIRHFIRGYFDGDGCIHVDLKKRNVALNLVGTYDFLNKIREIFVNELNISSVKILQEKDNKSFSLPYGSIVSIEKIYKYLYKDCNIYLQRKLDKFNTLFCLN